VKLWVEGYKAFSNKHDPLILYGGLEIGDGNVRAYMALYKVLTLGRPEKRLKEAKQPIN